jgi:hypothetical protein
MTEFEMGFWAQHRLREQREAAAIRRMLRAARQETGTDRSWWDRLSVALTRRTARRAEAS